LPKDVDRADTVARPVGVRVTWSAQALLFALATELN
jgi:hypothetical protein